MTSMVIETPIKALLQRESSPRMSSPVVSAAVVSVLLHIALLGVVVMAWSPLPPPASPLARLQTQLIALPPTPPTLPVPPAAAPLVAPQPAATPVEAAPLAHKRLQDAQQKQRENAERQAKAQQKIKEEKKIREAQRAKETQATQRQLEAQRQLALAHQQALTRQQTAAALLEQQRAEQTRADALRRAASQQAYLPIEKNAPEYPERALEKGIEGDCTVQYTVNTLGRVEATQVVGECHPLFIKPALTAAQGFRYQPRLIDGVPQAVSGVKNTFHFRIEP